MLVIPNLNPSFDEKGNREEKKNDLDVLRENIPSVYEHRMSKDEIDWWKKFLADNPEDPDNLVQKYLQVCSQYF